MKKQIEVLYAAYEKMNEVFFNGEVPKPAITIQTKGKHMAYGWASIHPIWVGEEKLHELNISAEYTNRPFLDIMGTVIHELVHLNHISKGIQDCSRGGTYHNKNFRAGAEAVGLEVTHHTKYGHAFTKVSEELEATIKSWGLDETVFNIARMDFAAQPTKGTDNDNEEGEDGDVNPKTGAKVRKSNSIKYTCPECGAIVRATKELNIDCGDCKVPFEAA